MEHSRIRNFLKKPSELTPKQLYYTKLITILVIIVISLLAIGFEKKPASAPVSSQEDALETRLEEILSRIKGAGEVNVLIVYKNNGTENLAKDIEYTEESDGSSTNKTMIVMGKDKEAIIVQKNIPDVQGVIVTAKGAWDPEVKENITKAVEAALPVLPHRIEVLTGE